MGKSKLVYSWNYKEAKDEQAISKLSGLINVNPYIAETLLDRGVSCYDSAKKYFRPSLEELHDPYLMEDMDKAVDRLTTAINSGEEILIFGDYDVDGTTSVALFMTTLAKRHKNIHYHLPDRYEEGYGLSKAGIDKASELGVTLLITIDCGITAVDKVDYARSKGIDVIICDHHRPGQQLPSAVAILDPKKKSCNYPYDELSGCGVGFKLLQAVYKKLGWPEEELFKRLDLLTISIGSDIVPITGENRILSFYGLKILASSPLPGIAALMETASVDKDNLTIEKIVFYIGPRINAAGRMTHAHSALELLIEEDYTKAMAHADLLEDNNKERKLFDKDMTQKALEMLDSAPDWPGGNTTVLFDPSWHKGLVGIVASRCIEHYYRPTIILTEHDGEATGSARSVPGFDIYEAISECKDLLSKFGGHKYAAGLSLPVESIDEFRQRFEEAVSQQIESHMLEPVLTIDKLIPLNVINDKFYNILYQMQPFGPGNEEPVFSSESVEIIGEPRLLKNEHIKLRLRQRNGEEEIEAIGFFMGHYFPQLHNGLKIDVAYQVSLNEFRGKKSVQLMLKDIKVHQSVVLHN
ncbi:single-stranded-DNA-specific exonuclease RecJ [Mangrovivirga sp. M17]|uniref:Single-stranded-DNA-specific exonuclease RecJ n=1 Tax=Mangrovivirga halotolerans TaxID=2993936 RepID=A0ABT3RSY6_9BACT|nr:single-stranded-DNA-specific exonuclease RecJ [Mangrovivirga halotolerans]MCX2744908.1 single-stranded-DNA-specific exonuclease RecJ [Mangrovivirga halotolerans]